MRTTELQSVDWEFGNFILGAFGRDTEGDELVWDPDHGSEEWQRFLTRTGKEKLRRIAFEDAREFVNKLLGAEIDKGTIDLKTANLPGLPMVGYCRTPGITNAGLEGKRMPRLTGYSADGETRAKVDSICVNVTYNLLFLAFDTLTLDKMISVFLYYARYHTEFDVRYAFIDGAIASAKAELADRQTASFDGASIPTNEGRLHAAQAIVSVNVPILVGEEIDALPESSEIEWAFQGYCNRNCCGEE